MTYSTETFDALVRLIQSVRQGWDTPGLRAAIREALQREDQPTLAEISYAALRVAENFAVTSPAVIAMDGPHWRHPLRDREPAKSAQCPKCRDFYPPHETHRCVKPAAKREEHADALRTALAEARESCCPHGIPPMLCIDHKATNETTGG
jgi:hypothetical protein